MSFGEIAAALMLALLPAAAQSPLPTLRIEPTTGGSIFYIKNTYIQPLTAYLIELVDYPGSSFWLWEDIPTSDPIPAGGEIRKPIANMTVGAAPEYVKMQAAIFADGSTAGVAEKITQLLERRRVTLQTVRELIGKFENAASKEALTADLKRWSDSVSPPLRGRSQTAIHQGAAKSMISDASSHLAKEPVEKVLADLRTLEHYLAASKPPL
jgi:hypothetical protein